MCLLPKLNTPFLVSSVADDDYVPVDETLTFTNTTREVTRQISANPDMDVEGPENFTLTLEVMEGVNVDDSVTVTITDRSGIPIHYLLMEYCCTIILYCMLFVLPARVAFEMEAYSVTEGSSVEVMVSVVAGSLDRSVEVVVQTASCMISLEYVVQLSDLSFFFFQRLTIVAYQLI